MWVSGELYFLLVEWWKSESEISFSYKWKG